MLYSLQGCSCGGGAGIENLGYDQEESFYTSDDVDTDNDVPISCEGFYNATACSKL